MRTSVVMFARRGDMFARRGDSTWYSAPGRRASLVFRAYRVRLAVVALIALAPGACRRPEAESPPELRGWAMGTSWKVVLAAGAPPRRAEEVERSVGAELERLESQMSHWREESDISRFNRHASTDPFPVPRDLAVVVAEALRVQRRTGGALDITAAPLIDAWGFGPEQRRQAPTDEELCCLREHVGAGRVEVLRKADGGCALRKSDPRVRLDLSALVKGYAIDVVAELLRQRGFKNFLIEFGGEIRASGLRSAGEPWRVGLEQPDAGSLGRVRRVITLRDTSIATSGDYRNFWMDGQDGPRHAHLIDPRTGRPVMHRLAAVSVLAPDAMTADALATALMVMGPREGFEWARRHRVAATFVERQGDAWRERSTPAFSDAVP